MQKPMAKLARKDGLLRCMIHASKCELMPPPMSFIGGAFSMVK